MRVGNGGLAGALRGVGGMLFAIGVFFVWTRRGTHHHWTDFELFLTLAVPAAALFALAVGGRSTPVERRAEPWRAVLLLAAVLLAAIALFQFLAWAGASTRHLLYDAAVLAAVASIAIYGARRAAAPYAVLLAGFALLGTWMLVWLKVFPHASADTVRVLILTGGVALLIAAGALTLFDLAGAGELATAGAFGAVAAGVQGVIVTAFAATIGRASELVSSTGESSGEVTTIGPARSQLLHPLRLDGAQTSGWNIYLLVVSVGLLWCAARSRHRGAGYVGALGVLAFLISVGAQLGRLAAGRPASSSVLGWPLILVLIGIAGLIAPLVLRRRTPSA